MTMLRFPGRTSSLPRFLMLVVAALMCGTRPTVNAGVVDEPAREGVVKVYPSEIRLATSRDEQSFVVQVTHSNGLTGDITSEVQATLLNPTLAKIDGNRVLPLADGATELHLVWRGQTVVVPVICDQAAVDRPISFRLDVMPVFMKSGCNQGSCHGAARGKDGFRLSLFGFDPAGDYYRLTREQPGRRLNLAVPRDSLLLEKAIGAVSHTGGSPIKKDDSYFRTILRWLERGAPDDSGPVPDVTAVELYPPQAVLNGEGSQQRLTVRARYADGTDRDVTSLAYFMSGNDNAATVTQQGIVTAANRGEAFVMARFGTHTVGVPFVVLPRDLPFAWSASQPENYIDEHVHDKLQKLRINPSELCTDEEFIRRATLDICGTLPTSEECIEFLADTSSSKREAWIDRLLERKEFVELWVMKWSELLQVRSTPQVSYKATVLYYNWLQEQIATNVPINEMVKQLMSAKGGAFTSPASNYYQTETDTLKVAENVAQVFMGMRIQCAQCHNHPFDRWTMDDYYGFAAFFSQIGRKQGEDPRETIVFNSGGGEVKHPVDGRVMPPKFLGGTVPDVAGMDRREVLANWLASADNPYFAKNLANMVWAHFFGRGIIEQVDDVRVSNPPVNAELLDALATRFTDYGYDFKKLVKDICVSRTYQLSTKSNASNVGDLTNFSHATLRRIRSELLLDVMTQVTDTENKFRGLPKGSRAVQIADGNTSNYFLTTFGRASRTTVCSCEVKMEPNLSQALHLLNGETVNSKIRQGNLVAKMIALEKSDNEIIDEIYLRCFSRYPTESERANLSAEVGVDDNRRIALEDVFWAVLNSREFIFNH